MLEKKQERNYKNSLLYSALGVIWSPFSSIDFVISRVDIIEAILINNVDCVKNLPALILFVEYLRPNTKAADSGAFTSRSSWPFVLGTV